MTDSKSARRLSGGIAIIVLLMICLAVTTFALVHVSVQVENNVFHTGTVKINLNDGAPVIREEEFLFEAGMTVKKDFFIENDSSCEVYYKLYFDQVSGGLADVLDITIRDGAQALYSGTARELIGAMLHPLNRPVPLRFRWRSGSARCSRSSSTSRRRAETKRRILISASRSAPPQRR